MTVLAPDGAGPVVFPVDAQVGDYYKADNDVTYELMSNGRWRNVIPLGDGYSDTDDGSKFVPVDVNDNPIAGPTEKIFELPSGGDSAAAGPLRWYNDDYYDSIPPNPAMDWYRDPSLPLPQKNRIYPKTAQFIGQTFRWVTDLTDPTNLEFYDYIPPQWQKIGDTVYAPGQFISAFNRPTKYTCGLELADYIDDMTQRENCKFRITLWQGRQPGGVTIDGTSLECEQFDEVEADKNYENTARSALTRTTIDYTDSAPNIVEWRQLDTGWIDIVSNAEAFYFVVHLHPGQIVADITLDIIDPSAGSGQDPSYRIHRGLGMSRNGDYLYVARPDTLEPESVLQVEMPTAYDLTDASLFYQNLKFDDNPEGQLGSVSPTSCKVDAGGYRMLTCDYPAQRVRQYGLRDEGIEYMGEYALDEGWDWADNYNDFVTIDAPLDAQYSQIGDSMIVLEDDGFLRKYTITSFDVSTAVIDVSVDIGSLYPLAQCFWISQSGRAIVIPLEGGYHMGTMETPYDIENIVWGPLVALPCYEPTGIFITKDYSKMFLTEIPSDTSLLVRVAEYQRNE